MGLARWLNTAWMLKCTAEAHAFPRATRCVAPTQAAVLAEILAANRDSDFGRALGFATIQDVRTYQQRVRLASYEDYAGAVAQIAAGKQGVLTRERVTLLEPTSGTTA